MKTFDIVIVGELNADLIFQDIATFPEIGKEILADGMTLTMGSASAIFASNLARLESNVGFAGKLGNDLLGNLVMDSLGERRVDTGGIIIDDDTTTGLTAVLSYPEDYAMVTYMGAMADLVIDDIDFDYVQSSKHLHVSSLYLQPGIKPDLGDLFKKAKENGLTTSMDPGWDPNEDWDSDVFEILKYVDIFLPNEKEALNITRKKSLEEAVNLLQEYSEIVLVTRGSDGTYCSYDGDIIKTRVYDVEVKDTTGAGDSFNAGFLNAWLAGKDVRSSIKNGVACGAIATTKAGGSTSSPNPNELNQFLETHTKDIFL